MYVTFVYMSDNDLPVKLDNIQAKVNKIIQMHNELKDENFKLQAEREQILRTLEDRKNTIQNLEEKNKRIKLAKSLSESNDSSLDTKLKINEMVREIDKCIAYLNK